MQYKAEKRTVKRVEVREVGRKSKHLLAKRKKQDLSYRFLEVTVSTNRKQRIVGTKDTNQ